MSKFNLDNYETVKSRKKKFYAKYPEGRILVNLCNEDYLTCALIKATLYRDNYDVPLSSGYAFELRDVEKSISKYGKEYETVNFSSWVENCEESAIGRALDNAGFAGNDKCSRDEMEKVERNKKAIASSESIDTAIQSIVDQIGCPDNHKNWINYDSQNKIKMLDYMTKCLEDSKKNV